MSFISYFLFSVIILFEVHFVKLEEDLLTRLKELDDPNDLWNLLKSASRDKGPEEEADTTPSYDDEFFDELDDDDDLFKSEESNNDVSTTEYSSPIVTTTNKPFKNTPVFTTVSLETEKPIATEKQIESIVTTTETVNTLTNTNEQPTLSSTENLGKNFVITKPPINDITTVKPLFTNFINTKPESPTTESSTIGSTKSDETLISTSSLTVTRSRETTEPRSKSISISATDKALSNVTTIPTSIMSSSTTVTSSVTEKTSGLTTKQITPSKSTLPFTTTDKELLKSTTIQQPTTTSSRDSTIENTTLTLVSSTNLRSTTPMTATTEEEKPSNTTSSTTTDQSQTTASNILITTSTPATFVPTTKSTTTVSPILNQDQSKLSTFPSNTNTTITPYTNAIPKQRTQTTSKGVATTTESVKSSTVQEYSLLTPDPISPTGSSTTSEIVSADSTIREQSTTSNIVTLKESSGFSTIIPITTSVFTTAATTKNESSKTTTLSTKFSTTSDNIFAPTSIVSTTSTQTTSIMTTSEAAAAFSTYEGSTTTSYTSLDYPETEKSRSFSTSTTKDIVTNNSSTTVPPTTNQTDSFFTTAPSSTNEVSEETKATIAPINKKNATTPLVTTIVESDNTTPIFSTSDQSPFELTSILSPVSKSSSTIKSTSLTLSSIETSTISTTVQPNSSTMTPNPNPLSSKKKEKELDSGFNQTETTTSVESKTTLPSTPMPENIMVTVLSTTDKVSTAKYNKQTPEILSNDTNIFSTTIEPIPKTTTENLRPLTTKQVSLPQITTPFPGVSKKITTNSTTRTVTTTSKPSSVHLSTRALIVQTTNPPTKGPMTTVKPLTTTFKNDQTENSLKTTTETLRNLSPSTTEKSTKITKSTTTRKPITTRKLNSPIIPPESNNEVTTMTILPTTETITTTRKQLNLNKTVLTTNKPLVTYKTQSTTVKTTSKKNTINTVTNKRLSTTNRPPKTTKRIVTSLKSVAPTRPATKKTFHTTSKTPSTAPNLVTTAKNVVPKTTTVRYYLATVPSKESFVTTPKSIQTTKKPTNAETPTKRFHKLTTNKVRTTVTTKMTTTTNNINKDILPPPPLPPLPPPPSDNQRHLITPVLKKDLCPKHQPCRKIPPGAQPISGHKNRYNPIPTTPKTDITIPRPVNRLEPHKTFFIPENVATPTSSAKPKELLLPEKKFFIPVDNPIIKSQTTEKTTKQSSWGGSFGHGDNNRCPQCDSYNRPKDPNYPFITKVNPNSNFPNQIGNRYNIILTDNKPQLHVSRNLPEVKILPSRGTFQIFPLVVERRINPSSNHEVPEDIRRPSHSGPIFIRRHNSHPEVNSDSNFVVRPKFDFIITNVSHSDGQFQIKPAVRSHDQRKLYFHISDNKPVDYQPTGQRDLVFFLKNPSTPQHNQHPHSSAAIMPADRDHGTPVYGMNRRNRRSIKYEPEDVQGSSLAFVFDTTGSMAEELNQVRRQATALAQAMTVHPDKPIYNYVFIPFNDPDVGPFTKTTNHAYFQSILDGVTVDRGGDCPEMSMTGLKLALEESLPRSFIYVFTDAGAKDSHLIDDVLALIQKKQSMVVFLLTGQCEYADREFYQTVSFTSGGQVYDLDKTDIKDVLEFIKDNLNSRIVSLVSIDSKLPAPQPKPYNVPVDELLDELTVSVSGKNPKLLVYEPNGNEATPSSTFNKPNLKVVNVKDPEPGDWTIKVGSDSPHSVRSTALSKSSVKFSYGFSVIPTHSLAETAHRPLQGADNSLLVSSHLPTTVCNLTQVRLIDSNGKTIGIIPLVPINEKDGLYSGGPLIPPNMYFNMEVHGFDSEGNKLIRIFPSAITPQLPALPEVTMKTDIAVAINEDVSLECLVESLVPVTIQWYKDGHIKSTVEYRQSSKSVFFIKNVVKHSAGNYTCVARNAAGISTRSTHVTIAEAPSVHVNDEVVHHIYSSARILCRVYSELPYNITWSRKASSYISRISSLEEPLSSYTKRPSDDKQNDYIINEVKIEDEGWYSCTASNKGGSNIGITYLKVLSSPLIEEPSPIKFTSRIPLVISCKLLRPEPNVTVLWEKKDSQIKLHHTTMEGGEQNNFIYELVVYEPDKSDEGFYRCIASNNIGTEMKTIRVTFVSEPKVKADQNRVTVKEYTTATLKCTITEGIPPPTVTWYTENRIEIVNTNNLQISDTGTILTVKRVSQEDVSRYYCVAKNEVGHHEAFIDLILAVKPKIILPDIRDRWEVELGGSLDVPCEATGEPSPSILWMKSSSGNTYEFYENILRIQDANLENEGEYTCVAKNPFGTDEVSLNITLTGLEKPTINGRETITKVKGLVGQRMELPCILLSGNPIPNISWYKDGIRLSPSMYHNIILNNGSFVIQVLTLRHVGNYECRAHNIMGQDKKQYSLSTYDAPKMNMSLGSFILAKVGSNVTLPCQIRGDPQPVVTWIKEYTLTEKPNRGYRMNESDNLYITNVKEEDSGRYVCKAENIAGIARRAVILSVISTPRIQKFPAEISAISGEVVFLSCQVQGTPRPSIRWLKDDKPLSHVRGSIGNNYLRFFSDPSDAGEYTCIAENKAGEDRATTYLTILEPPKIDETSENQVEGILGQSVILPCKVSGTPKPFVIWQHKGQTINKIIPSDNSSSNLHLVNITEEHKGTYTCTASNKAGSNRKTLELSVLIPPTIEDWNSPIRVIPGDTVTLSCKVSGIPKPAIKWSRNNLPLSPEFFSHENILRFIVESSHSGNYTCTAKNKAGNSTKNVIVSVYEAPKFLLEQSEDLEILQGSDVKLICSAIGDPKPTISWFYNGRILENEQKIRFFQDKDTMLISDFREEDEGIYECAATNKAGSNSRSIKINVLIPPKIIKSSGDLSVREGNEVILSCDATGKPEPSVVWKKDGVPLPSDFSYRGSKIRFIATASDQGNYSCHSNNKVGSDVKHSSLRIKVHPQILSNQEEDIVVLWGDGLELKCEAKGLPQPTISWNFNSTLLNSLPNNAFQLRGSNLFIPLAEFHNAGLYICFANNSLGIAQKTFQVSVHVPPSITDESQDTITLKEGEDFSISCTSYGVPTPDIFWIYNDSILRKGYHDEHYVVMNDHTLIISNAQLNMSGNYFCIATNIEGHATKNYTIEVTVGPNDLMSAGNRTLVEIEESDNGVLNCPLSEGPINWLKDDDAIDFSGNERADDIHLSLLEGGHTLKLTESYPSDTGVYTCFNDNGKSSEFFVSVLVRPHFVQEFPQTEFELKQGDLLTLDCNAAGNPVPKINWRHVEKDIPITRHTVPGVLVKGEEKDTLHFPSIRIEHAGRYMCIASNKVGKEGRVFAVKVTEPPILLGEREEKITAIAGNTLDLDCQISGSPKPRYSWKRITSTGHEFPLRYSQNKYMINNLSSKDGGIYICNGTNKVGSTVKYFFVFVLEKPTINGEDMDEIHLAAGKHFEVECEAYGVPLPLISWQLDSRQIDTTRAIITSTKPLTNGTLTSTLRIKTVDHNVAGVYTCLASNDVGTAQKYFRLSIIVPPVLLDQSFLFNNKSVDVNEGQSIYLSCPVKSDVHVNIEWFFITNGNRTLIQDLNNSNLYVSSARPTNSGIYTCVASNPAGKVEAFFHVHISVPPTFVSKSHEKSLTLTQEDELILNCSVASKPQSQIIWLKDGLRITGRKHSNSSLLNHNQTLIVSDIKASDSGRYICIASNSAGSAERSFQVSIHEAPKIEGMLSGQMSVVTNITETHYNRVILRCPITGSPQPTIVWYKDGSLVTLNERIHITPQGNKLIIFYLTEEDAGHYSCRAQNQAGINQLFFHLNVKVPLEWSAWSDWSNCSKSCDNGEQMRNRTCGQVPPLKFQLSSYVEYDKSACTGGYGETRACNTHPCKIDGGWGGWSEWGSCSASCGLGTKTRARRCNNPAPAFGGARCKGLHLDTSPCSRPPCPVDGKWSGWTEWSECTVSCGGGLKFRERRCNSPEPSDGGRPCPGSYRDVVVCNQHKCPIDGRWSIWGAWNQCSVTCGKGIQIRRRLCYKPLHGGNLCSGPNKEVRECENPECANDAFAEALRRSAKDHEVYENGLLLGDVPTDLEHHSENHSSEIDVSEKRLDHSQLGITPDSEGSSKILYLSGSQPSVVKPLSISDSVKPMFEIDSSGVYKFKDNLAAIDDYDNVTSSDAVLSSKESKNIHNSDEIYAHFKRIKCPSGYRYNKTSNQCQDINECKHKKRNRCNKSRSRCINTIGSFKCICASGYRLQEGPKKRCVDINECKEKTALCSHFCHNTKGSYKCSCPDGLTLLQDTHTCLKDTSDYPDYPSLSEGSLLKDYDDSDVALVESNSDWSGDAEDRNHEPSFQKDSEVVRQPIQEEIICPNGFIKDNDICKDINECTLELDECSPEQVCINTLGYYKCYDAPCPQHFDLVPSIRSCQLDCRKNSSNCHLQTKVAETITYETFDTENKTISSLMDLVVLFSYDENKHFVNDSSYSVSKDEKEFPVDIRKENNAGILYATDDFYVKNIQRVDVMSITYSNNSHSDILYTNHFVVFIYNSYIEN